MSIGNFIPTLWAGAILSWLEKSLVYASCANRNYEGQIKQAGDKVKISEIGDITINSYAKTDITLQTLESAAKFLEITEQRYFAFIVDDIDNVQMNVDAMDAASRKAAYALRDVADQFIASKYTDAGVLANLGTTGTPLTVTSDGASSSTKGSALLSKIQRALDDSNCPKDGRWLVAPPWLEQKLIMEKILLPMTNTTAVNYDNGRIGQKVFGFDFRVSNNVPVGSSKYRIMAGVNDAISFAEQIQGVEAFRPQLRFADALKGLHVYGAKVVRPEVLACATVLEGST
jgi:hypothetical protein